MIIQGVTLKNTGFIKDVVPVTSGLQLYLDSRNPASWPGSGTTWYDLSGNGKHATFYKNPSQVNVGGPTPTEATAIDGSTLMSGGDIYFNGTSSAAQYQYAAGPNLGTNITTWTINTWFKIKSFVASSELPAIFTGIYTGYGSPKGDSVNFSLQFYDGGVTNNNQLYGAFYNPNWQVTTGYSPSLNTWYNGVVTYDGSTINMYMNNTLVGTATNRLSTTLNSSVGYHVARRWDGWDTFDGYVPVAMLYNRALTIPEITQNFNYYRNRYGM